MFSVDIFEFYIAAFFYLNDVIIMFRSQSSHTYKTVCPVDGN